MKESEADNSEKLEPEIVFCVFAGKSAHIINHL